MSFVSIEFLLFLLAAVIIYYIIPKKAQWFWLLICSYAFYLSGGTDIIVFLLFTTMTTYLTGLLLKRQDNRLAKSLRAAPLNREEKKKRKNRIKIKKRWIIAFTMLLNFGVLGWLKYYNFAVENLNYLFHAGLTPVPLLLPLGISFYTFQSIGYIIDVYHSKYEPEKNPFKFALFVSFFPQMLQGPIGRFDRLAHQFLEPHRFDLIRIERGLQLMLWGYFKKLVVANRSALIVNQVFNYYESYTGMTVVVAVLFYSIDLYADFSGGMDVVMGASECFGISLDQNFKRPYFAKSISDFWHRWHITLGSWMRDYIFYPFSLSKGMTKFGKILKKIFGKHIGRVLPVCLANILIFFIVGVWHGADWKYIVYGLYNGLIIAFSNLFEPLYSKLTKLLHINTKCKPWQLFQILRTFLLVNISWFFDMGKSVDAAFVMMKNVLVNFSFSTLWDGSLLQFSLSTPDFIALGIGCLAIFTVSCLQECKINIRESLAAKPLPIRWATYLVLIFSIPLMGQLTTISGGGFIYAQF